MLAAPMARLQKKSRRQSPQVRPVHPAFPARGLYGLYVLSPGTGFLAPVARPRHAASLASAPGCQDHTISPSVPACARLAQPSRPSQPASTYRDDAYAPPREAGWRHQNMISEKTKQIYFSRSVLSRRMRLMLWTKSGVRRAIKAFPLWGAGKICGPQSLNSSVSLFLTWSGRANRHAASGRHAMTPSVRARTTGEARQVATASYPGAPR